MNPLLVIKVGTGVLTRDDGRLDGASLVRLVTAVAGLKAEGYRCVLVSSGAVGAGVGVLGLDGYPEEVEVRQAAAAVGQARLMHRYETLFGQFDLGVAQLLLTGEDLGERGERVRGALGRLLSVGHLVPVVNENDSVAVDELRVGDNDLLSARVACLLGAEKLVLLTTVDGLLDEGGELIPEVKDVSAARGMVREERGRFSIGGMLSKLDAVEFASREGVEVVIANGREPERLIELAGGGGIGTRFQR